ncbi:uncharacterized protein [Clytia hemisphaerica]|uniref:uncharacterized protein n=1 Tax=Clytia hemisphaerica TaxID=252671 RepID=UPI0034D57087
MKILYTNPDQLTSFKKKELQSMAREEKPHIIAICEAKTKAGALKELHEYEFDDYKIASQVNLDTDQGRGIVIFVHISIKHLVIDVKPPVTFNEVCMIEVQLSGKDLLAVACIYRSPTRSTSSNENNNNLNLLIKSIALNKKYSHKCLLGDFNFPTINWENWTTPHLEDSKEEKFLNALRDAYLHQHVNEPTRCRGTDDPSLIDLILTGEENQIRNLDYLRPLGKSDHSSLAFNFVCYAYSKPTQTRFIYASANFKLMKNDPTLREWKEGFKNSSVNKSVEDLWESFKKVVIDLRNRFVPLKEVGNDFWRKKGKVPIDKNLQDEIKLKKTLHRRWLRSAPLDRDRHRANYTIVRNRVNRLMSKAHRTYEKSICDKSKEKPKIFWSHVRSKLKSSSGVSPLLENPDDKSSIKHDDLDKANILQKQFCSVFTNEPPGTIPDFPTRTEIQVENIIITEDMMRKTDKIAGRE